MVRVEAIEQEKVSLSRSYIFDRGVGATGIAYNVNVAALAEEAP
jgi:hypothetical protein